MPGYCRSRRSSKVRCPPGFRIAAESLAFLLIHLLDELGWCLMSVLALIGNVDGGGSCASFVQESLLAGEVQPVAVHDFSPGIGVVGHGVEQHAVHVE